MAQNQRVTFLNEREVPRRNGIAYWMQASVRSRANHALEYAVHLANHRGQDLRVFFALSPGYPGANLRHYWFLVEGLRDTAGRLRQRGIGFTLYLGNAPELALAVSRRVSTLVTDMGYTRIQREWRRQVAEQADCPLVQVESNVVVPVETASSKEEFAARTIRPRIHRHMETFLRLPAEITPATEPPPAFDLSSEGFRSIDPAQFDHPDRLTDLVSLDTTVDAVNEFHGGESDAQQRLGDFVRSRLLHFDERRNIPDQDWSSCMSAYLHFGHISPIEIVLRAREAVETELGASARADLESFEEELVVRRELAMNFTHYNDAYDRFEALPDYARATLTEHAADPRPASYSLRELEEAETDDLYWNACQREMRSRGKMHGYMRMYWGKKILEWTADPAEAMARAIELNDRYELDGRDPNGYTGVAWCFGKHDRGWPERPVFGKVRYMNSNGLKRKFKEIDLYLHRWRA